MAVASIFNSPSDPYKYLKESVSLNGLPLANIDVTAEEYLQYAAEDLSTDTRQGFINGMGNAKRALHLMIDSLLNVYGLWARNKSLGFPGKLKLLDAAGLFSLSILQTLNLERNVIEHEYRVPTKQRVQEMVDVGRLLLLATQRLSEFVTYECLAVWRDGDIQGIVQLNPGAGQLSFFKVTGPTAIAEWDDGQQITVLQNIRFLKGGLAAGIEINPNAMWEHKLSFRNMDEWAPLLRPIVELSNFKQTPQAASLYDNTLSISVRISVPLGDADIDKVEELLGPIIDWSTFKFGFRGKSATN